MADHQGVGRWALSTVVAVVLGGTGFALVVPVGEAPDEQAHLAYVDHLLEHRRLPPLPATPGLLDYQAYQPPLDYAASAALLGLLHGGRVAYPFLLDPGLEAGTSHRRFLPSGPEAAGPASAVRRLRVARLLWAALTALLVVAAARAALPADPRLAVIAALPLALAPQYLFISASINNDALLTTLCSAALVGCLALVGAAGSRRITALAWGVGAAAGLALWAKASAVVLAPPLLLVATLLARRRRGGAVLGLLAPPALGAAGWALLSRARFGASVPPPPSGFEDPGGPLVMLLTEPWWIVRLWGSFWANFGWVSVQLPRPLYVAFLPASALLLWGAWVAVRRLAGGLAGGERELVALTLAASTLFVLLVYMVRVDWQPQGRYLFPALAACGFLAARGLGDLADRWPALARLGASPLGPAAALAYTAALVVASLVVVTTAYGHG